MTRAVQRVVRSFVAWGVVVETGERGIFAPAPRIAVHDAAVAAWLLEAGIVDTARHEYPLHSLVGSVSFYPFDIKLSARDVTRRPSLEIYHQALDGSVVTWKRVASRKYLLEGE